MKVDEEKLREVCDMARRAIRRCDEDKATMLKNLIADYDMGVRAMWLYNELKYSLKEAVDGSPVLLCGMALKGEIAYNGGSETMHSRGELTVESDEKKPN